MKYIIVIILFLSNSAHAAEYYYCDCQTGASNACVSGNDKNDGLSISSPKQTFVNAHALFSRLSAGETIQFCRGGAFSTSIRHKWANNNCTATDVCTITSYNLPDQTTPQLDRPIITQTGSNHLFALNDNGGPDEGYIFSHLDLRCTECINGNSWAFFLFNDVNYVTIRDIAITGFDIAVHLAKNKNIGAGSDGTHDFITLENLTIVDNKRQGVLGGANNLIIRNSYFENNGGGNKFEHNIYVSSGDNIIISGNELYRSSIDVNGSCAGTILVVHGHLDNLLIENNVIHEDIGKAGRGCWGISVSPAYLTAETFTNITIRGNKVVNVGNIGIGVASCDTCIIENNIIIQQQNFKFTAISAPNRSRDAMDLSLNNILIRNNSIYTRSAGTGIVLDTEGQQHVVVSNAIYYTGIRRYICFNLGLSAASYTAIDNNICYFPNALNTSEWELGSGVEPNPLEAWQASGFDLNSSIVDPSFTTPNLPFANLSQQDQLSPLINFGHQTLSAPIDSRGKTRDDRPDAGAFEFGVFNPPAKTKAYLM